MQDYIHKLSAIVFLMSIVVIYGEIICLPEVFVKNCRDSIAKSNYFSWSSEINLLAILSEGCDSKNLRLKWRLWKVDPKDPTKNLIKKPLREIHSGPLLSIKASELELGFYLAKLHVKLEAKSISVYYKNNFTCYFEIKIFPLKPIIAGGNKRYIRSKKNELVLSARKSVDPNQEDNSVPLLVRWSCTSNLSEAIVEDICKGRILRSTEPYVIPGHKLPDLGQFTFTLEIWSNKYDYCIECLEAREHRFAHQIVIIDSLDFKRDFVSIICFVNCVVSATYKEVILKVELNLLSSNTMSPWSHSVVQASETCQLFQWNYQKKGNSTVIHYQHSAKLPQYIFRLPEGTLDPESSYIVNVTTRVHGVLLADSFLLETNSEGYTGTCAMEPMKGIRGETTFDVICTKDSSTDFTLGLTFEFYDMTPEQANEDDYLNSRILGITNCGLLKDVLLTRGTVVIVIRNSEGFHLKKHIQAELKDQVGMSSRINAKKCLKAAIDTLNSLIESRIHLSILQEISFVTDVFPNYLHEQDIFKLLLTGIHSSSIKPPTDVKDTLFTLHNLLLNLKSSVSDFPDIETMKTVKLIIFEQMKHLSSWRHSFSSEDMIEITEVVLNNLHLSLDLEKNLSLKMSALDLETKYVFDILESSVLVEKILDIMGDILVDFQNPGMPPTTIASANYTFEIWALVEDPNYSYTLTNMLDTFTDIPTKVSTQFLQSVKRDSQWEDKLSLCVIKVNDNIFHWFSKEFTSNLLILTLSKKHNVGKQRTTKIKNLVAPIDFTVNFNNTELNEQFQSGETTQLDPNMEPDYLDSLIKVHRFDPEPRGMMSLTFLYPSTNATLRVVMMRDYRPTYEIMISKSEFISEINPIYSLTYNGDSEPISFYYLAVLPGPEVPVNHKVKYSFSINSTACQAWTRMQWSSAGCRVGPDTSGSQVHCQCKHLSIFGALSRYLPNQIDPFSDAKLFFTVLDNPLVVSVILAMFIIYLMVSLWAYHKDKKDRCRGAVSVLDDNFPGDREAYLLAVYTSSRFLAGTTANVGIRLIGEDATSRTHILNSRYHKVLTRDSDDWFLLFSPESLGPLKQIHIWHDNSGLFPSWHCDKIHVYDLKNRLEILFVVDQWVELNQKYYPEAVVVPATPDDLLNPKMIFFQNLFDVVRCRSVSATGIFMKHPRVTMTRVQLASVVMCTTFTVLLCSIMFYGGTDVKPDDFAYNVSKRDIVVSFIALCISGFINYLIRWEFNKSFKSSHSENVCSLCLRDTKFDDYDLKPMSYSSLYRQSETGDGTGNIIRRKMSKSRSTFRRLINYSKPKPLPPVTMAYGRPVVKTKYVWLTIAWFSCIILIFSCMYLIMLYGLKMGLNKSKKWVTSITLSIVEDSVFVSPISILMTAILLSGALELNSAITSYQITKDELYETYKNTRDEDLVKVLTKRYQPMYYPITAEKAAGLIIKKRKVHNLIKLTLFLISLFYITVVGCLFYTLWSSKYYANSHLVQLITLPRYRNMGFFKSRNYSEENRYLEMTFLKSLYSSKWYNDWPFYSEIENEYWTSDYTWKMVGPPSIRQLRVKAESCRGVLAETSCVPAWSSRTEDRDMYSIAWDPYEYREAADGDPWLYTSPNVSWINTLYRLSGLTGTVYDSGGYIARLQSSVKNSFGTITELASNSWQDPLTSAVFVELTLCNVNLRVFSQITLITEYPRSVSTFKTARVFSAVECILVDVWLIIFTLVTLVFVLYLFFKINREGLCFFGELSNVVFLISVLLGFSIIIIHSIKVFQCVSYSFSKRYGYKTGKYFNYDLFISYHLQMAILLSSLLLLTMCQIILKCQEGIIPSVYVEVIRSCLKSIFFLQIMCCISLVFLWKIMFKTNTQLFDSFIEFIVQQRRIENVYIQHFRSITLVFTLLKFLILYFISALFVTVFKYINKTSRMKQRYNNLVL